LTKQEYIDEAKRLAVIDAGHAWDMLHDKDKLGEVEKWDKELNKMSGSDRKSDEQTLVHWDVDLKDFLRMSYIMKTFFESFGLLEGELTHYYRYCRSYSEFMLSIRLAGNARCETSRLSLAATRFEGIIATKETILSFYDDGNMHPAMTKLWNALNAIELYALEDVKNEVHRNDQDVMDLLRKLGFKFQDDREAIVG